MELDEALAKRRSIRNYKKDPVPEESVLRVLEAAHSAPSGANACPWLYKVVTDPALKKAIREKSEAADAAWNAAGPDWFKSWMSQENIAPSAKGFLEDAPYLLIVFADTRMPYALESTWISIGFAFLAATQEGLGTLTYTPGDPSFPKSMLGVERHYALQAILPLGFPAEAPDPRLRRKHRFDWPLLEARPALDK